MEFYTTSRITGRTYTAPVIFARNTKAKLSELVKGSINTDINYDTLVVTIYGVNDIVFRYTLNNISHEIVQGRTSEMVAQTIYKRYNSYIRNLFFL